MRKNFILFIPQNHFSFSFFCTIVLHHHNKWNKIGSRSRQQTNERKKNGREIWHNYMTGGRTRDIWLLGLKEDMKAIDFLLILFCMYGLNVRQWKQQKNITIVSFIRACLCTSIHLYSIHAMSPDRNSMRCLHCKHEFFIPNEIPHPAFLWENFLYLIIISLEDTIWTFSNSHLLLLIHFSGPNLIYIVINDLLFVFLEWWIYSLGM